MEHLDPGEILKSFGVASPVILTLIWLLIRAELRADRYQRDLKLLQERFLNLFPIIVDTAKDATKAIEVMNRRLR